MPPLPGGGEARAQQYARQDRMLRGLERLEAKDTQAGAYEELKRLIWDLDAANLSTLLHAAGSHNARTQYARVHCLRLAALCTTPGACQLWAAMLQPPLLGKLLGLLGGALRDGDTAVRATAAECFGVVAAQLAAAHPGTELTGGCCGTLVNKLHQASLSLMLDENCLPGYDSDNGRISRLLGPCASSAPCAAAGDHGNPLLACLLDALGEPGGAVQAAAAAALAQAADYLAPLEPSPLRQLLRILDNPLFGGRPELCQAVAWVEAGQVRGLVASSFHALLGLMPEVLGSAAGEEQSTIGDQTASGHASISLTDVLPHPDAGPGAAGGGGLLGALVSRGKDFQLRAAAAHTLKALAVGVGPYATGWDAAVAALKAAKTDVSKPVRDAAIAALPCVSAVQEFVDSRLPPEQWPAVCGSLLAAEAERAKQGGQGTKARTPCCGSNPANVVGPGVAERIQALHPPHPPVQLAVPCGMPLGSAPAAAA